MKPVVSLTPLFAVTGALEAADFAEAARRGFKSIVSNLPDGELGHAPSAAEAARIAEAAGLAYRHIPVTKAEIFSDRVVGGMVAAARDLEGPILAHCASGMRSAVAWGAAAARFQSADAVLGTLQAAGFNLAPLRDEFVEQGGTGDGAVPGPLKLTS